MLPDWAASEFVSGWLTTWPPEIVFSLIVGALAGLATMMFGEGRGK